ncbi:hypothetical protein [Pectobacterium fontis]|uniref:Membrane protein n=1 Tax=Pectobacterium fontis TaxID=2558042 RepID=A0A7V8IHN1_9GAMM|nr:hypothetical protein [Pectobacterium fontis]KHN50797.1 membrane protein [Pectobacterium fontis]
MSDNTMTNRIMQIHLSSWRYFAALTLPPVGLIFTLFFSIDCVILMVLFLLTHYYCWRLWLDEKLFQLLDNENDLSKFDNGMAYLWGKKTCNTRTLAERWRGTRDLFYRAMFSLMALWFASLCSTLYRAITRLTR